MAEKLNDTPKNKDIFDPFGNYVKSSTGSKKSNLKTVAISIGIIAIVTTSTLLVGLNQGWFDFGEEEGIFPIISYPAKTEKPLVFLEGYPIKFNSTVYSVESGTLARNSIEDVGFRQDLNYTWYLRKDGWRDFVIISSGRGLKELTTASLKPGTYTIKVEVSGILQDYDILIPQDYAIAAEANYVYNEMIFEIKPFTKLSAYILNPQNYQTFLEGESITFSGYAGKYVNNTEIKLITSKNVEEFNNAMNWLSKEDLRDILSSQLHETSINATINDLEYLDPIKINNDNLDPSVSYYWYDDYVDEDDKQHPLEKFGEGQTLSIDNLEIGSHTITLRVVDDISLEQKTVEINLWIATLEQPTVPYANDFCNVVDIDGNILFNWEESISKFQNIKIDYYEVQRTNHIGNFDSEDVIIVSGNETCYYFTGLEPSTSLVGYQDGKHWFRVRAIDTMGEISFWSNPIGVTVNTPPENVFCSGIYSEGIQSDFQTSYHSKNGEILLNEDSFEGGEEDYLINQIFYDFYEGQFENISTRHQFEDVSFIHTPKIYQYQDFSINFSSEGGSFDLDDSNIELVFYVFSDDDGLIYKGTGITESNPISWNTHIKPYLIGQSGNSYPTLSSNLHTITVVVHDNFNLAYQLPSLLLNISSLKPNWNNRYLQGIPEMFYDLTGDGKMDWDRYGIEWNYPNFNPYMPNQTLSPGAELWDKETYKLQYWEIEVLYEYGGSNYTELIQQTNPTPRHFWYHTNDLVDDSISPWDLSSGNYTFRVRAVDCNFLYSEWTEKAVILNNNSIPLPNPYKNKLPILLNKDNPPPCAWINYAELNSLIYEVETGETFSLSGLNSSDINGDSLSYTWKFDGIVRKDLLPDFDPYQPVITINPEWIGNDNDIAHYETDLSDGDQYGDFGEHLISLEVSDGNSISQKDMKIFIVPKNFIPTFDISYTGIENNAGKFELYQGYSLTLCLDHLIHYDHPVDKQNISVTLIKESLDTGMLLHSESFTITSEEINQNQNYLNDEYMVNRGYIYREDVKQHGDFKYTFIVDDGIVSVNDSIEIGVLEDTPPEDLTAEILDLGENSLYDGKNYIVLPGQALLMKLDWIHAPIEENIEIIIESSEHLNPIYLHENEKLINLASNSMFFNTAGKKSISISISDRIGHTLSISLSLNVLMPSIFPEYLTDTVESSIYSKFTKTVDYDDLDRNANDLPSWFMRLGDNNPETDNGYFINDIIEISDIHIPSAKYIRVWFQLDARLQDELEFYDGSGNLIWTIRRTITKNDLYGDYQYKDHLGSWHSLPQMSLLDKKDQLSKNYRNDWNIRINNRLVYVVIPDSSYSIRWVTGGRDDGNFFSSTILDNIHGLEGFKIGYMEALAEKPLGILNPLKISMRKILNKIGNANSLAGKIFLKAWSACLEQFKLNTFDMTWVSIPLPTYQTKFDNLELNIEIKYNIFTSNLIITGIVGYNIEDARLCSFLKSIDVEFTGFVSIDIVCTSATINEISLGIGISLSKSYSIIDLLLKFPSTCSIGYALKTYDDFAKEFRIWRWYPLPRITARITIMVSFNLILGWRPNIGSFVDSDFMASGTVYLFSSKIRISASLHYSLDWVKNRWLSDLSVGAYLRIRFKWYKKTYKVSV